MAVEYMQKVDFTAPYNEQDLTSTAYDYQGPVIAAPGNGNPVIIPGACFNGIGVVLEVTAGSGKVQYTIDSLAAIIAGTAVWEDWSISAVSANASDLVSPVVKAIRQVNIAGSTRLLLEAR